MTVRRRRTSRFFDIYSVRLGDRLRTKAVGCVPSFVGEVVFVGETLGGRRYVHLRHPANGDNWHRDANDLERADA